LAFSKYEDFHGKSLLGWDSFCQRPKK